MVKHSKQQVTQLYSTSSNSPRNVRSHPPSGRCVATRLLEESVIPSVQRITVWSSQRTNEASVSTGNTMLRWCTASPEQESDSRDDKDTMNLDRRAVKHLDIVLCLHCKLVRGIFSPECLTLHCCKLWLNHLSMLVAYSFSTTHAEMWGWQPI